MLKRILGLLGWLGVALVFAAVAIRFLKPEYQQYYNGLAIAGLVCTLLYILSQWREIGQSFSGRQARYGSLAAASVLVVLGILVAILLAGPRAPESPADTPSDQTSTTPPADEDTGDTEDGTGRTGGDKKGGGKKDNDRKDTTPPTSDPEQGPAQPSERPTEDTGEEPEKPVGAAG
jgi:hypothetical protein